MSESIDSVEFATEFVLGHTACIKSLMMPSNSVLFQLVAGLSLVQSTGVSSGTTTRGFGYPAAEHSSREDDHESTGYTTRLNVWPARTRSVANEF